LSTPKRNTVDFEQALADLEVIVDKLEHGELPLEEALRQFERGVALARVCQESLEAG
jgi:exodeoxyribonuclease VII small subunit